MRKRASAVFGSFLAGTLEASLGACPSFGAPAPSVAEMGSYEPGTQLNRARDYLEHERALRQIEQDRKAHQEKLPEEAAHQTPGNVPEVEFVLARLDIDPSKVLAQSEIEEVAAPYLNRSVKLAELYDIVNKINDLYSSKGFITCRAILPPQRIHEGAVHIRLVEGVAGKIEVLGNSHTREGYIRSRVALAEGEIANLKELNRDMLRFNGTNDVQLRIALKAGEAVGTTDYELSVTEPESNQILRVYADTNGYENNDRYRYGLMYVNHSLTGNRDQVSGSYLHSRGSDVFGLGYSFPITAKGTRLEVSGGYNRTEIVKGWMKPLGVKGEAYNVGLALRHPLIVDQTKRVELSLEYVHQDSETDLFVKTSTRQRWVDDKTDKASAAAALTHYSSWGILYHRHRLSAGRHSNIDHKTTNFKTYGLDSMYLMQFGRVLVQARLAGQYSFTSILPSAQRFYLGGASSVRGYEEGLINGEHGVNGSIELSTALWLSGLSAYAFVDAGKVSGKSSFGDKELAGAGIGLKYAYKNRVSLDVGLGVPLKRTINEQKQDSVRIHAAFTASY